MALGDFLNWIHIVHYGIPAFSELQRKPIGFSPVQIILL